jgi:HEPN domain-containing protein
LNGSYTNNIFIGKDRKGLWFMAATGKQWFDMATYDLETAKAMLKSKRYLYVGFMCSLAVEKSLKAVIADKGEFPPPTHNLQKLAVLSGIDGKLSEGQNEFINYVQPMQIEARYETYKNKIFQSLNDFGVCKDLINNTEALLKWIKEQLSN